MIASYVAFTHYDGVHKLAIGVLPIRRSQYHYITIVKFSDFHARRFGL